MAWRDGHRRAGERQTFSNAWCETWGGERGREPMLARAGKY
ncbi:hypothetical protein RB10824 [Rhodopirellula baltica SH 1]|uniref:Uncharacterized protein n=1 Tax=Rhodopirellula baltica (strain DSM 10527 / NCIMB 13988 / SH1) TaxID=243090 RepID=Q7UK69_RHOBA|nr:hypothetical protein RB10824 [Rhodopirellula baltica SH 1]